MRNLCFSAIASLPARQRRENRAFRISNTGAPLSHPSRCFIDDPADWAHVEALQARCTTLKCVGMGRWRPGSRWCMAPDGCALDGGVFANAEMAAWVTDQVQREKPDAVFVYSSAWRKFVTGWIWAQHPW